jgi:hypothetical protein
VCARHARFAREVGGAWYVPGARCERVERGSLSERVVWLAAIESTRGCDGGVWVSMAAALHLRAPAQGSLGTKGVPMPRAVMKCGSIS